MKNLVVFLLLGGSAARGTPPIIHHDFESSESGWVTMGGSGSVHLTREPANVKSGKSALAFDYTAAPKSFSVALFPLTDVSLANMKTLRFWLKTDSAVGIGVILNEKQPGGGNFTSSSGRRKIHGS